MEREQSRWPLGGSFQYCLGSWNACPVHTTQQQAIEYSFGSVSALSEFIYGFGEGSPGRRVRAGCMECVRCVQNAVES